jgi:hypothetical protein
MPSACAFVSLQASGGTTALRNRMTNFFSMESLVQTSSVKKITNDYNRN